jgi:uncharacterized BrkB/YihY/UPF0761 family membrane protein
MSAEEKAFLSKTSYVPNESHNIVKTSVVHEENLHEKENFTQNIIDADPSNLTSTLAGALILWFTKFRLIRNQEQVVDYLMIGWNYNLTLMSLMILLCVTICPLWLAFPLDSMVLSSKHDKSRIIELKLWWFCNRTVYVWISLWCLLFFMASIIRTRLNMKWIFGIGFATCVVSSAADYFIIQYFNSNTSSGESYLFQSNYEVFT